MSTKESPASSLKLSNGDPSHIEHAIEEKGVVHSKDGDAALAILGDGSPQREVTAEEDKAVLRKIDLWVMPVLLLVYFLQQLDK